MIKVLYDNTLHAYIPLLPAVKNQNSPIDRIETFAKIMIFHQFLCKNRENHFNSKQKLSQEAVSDHFRQGGFSENNPYIAEPEPDMAA
ncbi:MAG: hypothetical protein BWX65_00346 [Bacteroidetes bacterium ADurb.Bin057]|jgi:hypothetical protein|nr:MAG: hypothetical protein BWX65_00346 [Bacteroidetes bacterium ADurb.Bin057]